MATFGLFHPVIARRIVSDDGFVSFCDGQVIGKAISLEVTPSYVSVSEYSDINDLDPQQMFVYADATLKLAEITGEAEEMLLSVEDGVFADKQKPGIVGFGIIQNGNSGYTAVWFPKAIMWLGAETRNTHGDDFTYTTPSLTGKILPDDDGIWKVTKKFTTKNEAIVWLNLTANER